MESDLEAVARGETDEKSARDAVWLALRSQGGDRTVYAALCRWTWRALVERRLDEGLKSWHRLLLDVASRMSARIINNGDADEQPSFSATAASERIKALADLVRLLIDAADASIPEQFTSRAHVLSILRLLTRHAGAELEREKIKTELGLRDANLSRVLTLLAANGLIERIPRGKEAIFRVTHRGIAIVEQSVPKTKPRVYDPQVGLVVNQRTGFPVPAAQRCFTSAISLKDVMKTMHEDSEKGLYRPKGGIYSELNNLALNKD